MKRGIRGTRPASPRETRPFCSAPLFPSVQAMLCRVSMVPCRTVQVSVLSGPFRVFSSPGASFIDQVSLVSTYSLSLTPSRPRALDKVPLPGAALAAGKAVCGRPSGQGVQEPLWAKRVRGARNGIKKARLYRPSLAYIRTSGTFLYVRPLLRGPGAGYEVSGRAWPPVTLLS